MTSLITTDLVRLGADWGSDKHDVIRALAGVVDDAGRATSKDQLIEDAFARESTSATGLPGGIAIPHCRTAGVEVPTLAFARLEPPVDFGAKDGPADLAFLIAAPAGGDADHLTILTKLARALVKPAFTDALRSAESVEEVVEVVTHELGEPAPAAAPASGAPSGAATPGGGETTAPTQAAGADATAASAAGVATASPADPAPSRRWSRSPPARPASPTPTWPPRRSRPPPSAPESTSRSRPRARWVPRRCRTTRSPAPAR